MTNALCKLTPLSSHCYTPTCFSPQGVLIYLVNRVNKYVSRRKHQIKEERTLCYILAVFEDFDAVDVTFLSLFVCLFV